MKKINFLLSIAVALVNTLGFCSQGICNPCVPFDQNDIAIVKSRYFYASLDPRDQRVPRVFVQTHSHIGSLSLWTDEHWVEFGRFAKGLEIGLKKTFNADLVNIACLMNLAGNEGTHTHWHFIPRLPKPFVIIDEATEEKHTFEDPCYGKPYDMVGKNYRMASAQIMRVLIRKIQSNLDMVGVPEVALVEFKKNEVKKKAPF